MPNETVAGLLISIDGNTVKLRSELDKARASTRAAAADMKGSMQDARGGVMVLGEEIGVHLPRHVQRFIASMPGVAAAMSAAFSLLAVIAIGAALFAAGKKAFEYGEKMKNAAREATRATEDFTGKLHLANLEHEVRLAKMDEEIAKLEHKPGNGLASSLAEARLEAYKLGEELRKDVEQAHKLIEEKLSANWFQRVTTGAAGNKGTLTQLDEYEAKGETVAKIIDPVERAKQLQALTAKKLQDLHEEITSRVRLQELQTRKGPWTKQQVDSGEFEEMKGLQKRFGQGDQSKVLSGLSAFHDMVQEQYQSSADTLEDIQTTGRLNTDKNAARALSEAHAAAQRQMKAFEDELAQKKELGQVSFQDEDWYWAEKQKALRTGSENYLAIQRKLGALHQQILRAQVENEKFIAQEWVRATREYNEAMKKQADVDLGRGEASKLTPWIQKENASDLSALMAKEDERTGRIRKTTAAYIEQQAAVAKLNRELQNAKDKQDMIAKKPQAEWSATSNPETAANTVLLAQGKLDVGNKQLDFLRQGQQFGTQMSDFLSVWAEKATNLDAIFGELFTHSLNSFNDTISKMATGQYKAGDWKKAGQSIFGDISKKGLEGAEGGLMKMIPGLGGLGKLGTKGNPMYTRSADGPGKGFATSGATAKGGGGWLAGLLKAFGGGGGGVGGGGSTVTDSGSTFMGGGSMAMADGGLMSPGSFYLTGERGKELVQVGSTSRINNAGDTNRILGAGGGGDVTHNHYYDCRGTDPSLTQANMERMQRQTDARASLIAAHVNRETYLRSAH